MVKSPLDPLLAAEVEVLQKRFPQYVDVTIDPLGSSRDVEFFSQVMRAVVAGHVREWRAPNRAYIEVDLPDRSVASTATYSGVPGLLTTRGRLRIPRYLHTYAVYE